MSEGALVLVMMDRETPGGNMAMKVANNFYLPGVQFVPLDSPHALAEFPDRNVFILAPMNGISDVVLLSPGSFITSEVQDLRFFRLDSFIQMVNKLGITPKIIGIPLDADMAQVRHRIEELLLSYQE